MCRYHKLRLRSVVSGNERPVENDADLEANPHIHETVEDDETSKSKLGKRMFSSYQCFISPYKWRCRSHTSCPLCDVPGKDALEGGRGCRTKVVSAVQILLWSSFEFVNVIF